MLAALRTAGLYQRCIDIEHDAVCAEPVELHNNRRGSPVDRLAGLPEVGFSRFKLCVVMRSKQPIVNNQKFPVIVSGKATAAMVDLARWLFP